MMRKNGKVNYGEMFTKMLDAVSDRHAEVDLDFEQVTVEVPGTPFGVELNGTITVSIHMRDLTEGEKKALATKNVALMSKAQSSN